MSDDREKKMEGLKARSRSPLRRRMAPSDRKNANSDKLVYISNIPYDITWMELKDMVREKAGDVAFVEMIETAGGKSKGSAVVEFKDSESVKKCVEQMHRMQVKDRFIVVKEIRDPERFFKKVNDETGIDLLSNKSGPKSLLDIDVTPIGIDTGPRSFPTYGLSVQFLRQLGIEGPLGNRIFVANLPFNVGPSKLKEVFSLSGQVVDVDLQFDNDGRNKGLAVIEYSHPIEAVQAVSMFHNQKYYDRILTVKMDRFEKDEEPLRPGELPPGLRSIGMGLGRNGAPLSKIAQLLGSGTGASGGSPFHGDSLPGSNVRNDQPVGGLSYMGGGGSNMPTNYPLPQPNLMSSYPQGQLSGYSANMNNPIPQYGNDPSRAMEASLSGTPISGPYPGGVGYSSGMNMSMNGNYQSIPSLMNNVTDFDRRQYDQNISPMKYGTRSARYIVIRNLPTSYTWQTLRDRLRGFGDIEFADIVQPGVGKVRFKTAMDAEKAAMAMNGILVEGRPIAVDLAITD
ncbi:unnamed protein product [Soboliphyme baturini]|uniref:Myelin expression factor 2 n=1 Tax=Soboliphyme baturini TaxID=241478 RepID=A0A183IR00_9BILA|nr:unnamed protein product [Soboliphyme baturini]